MQHLHRLRNKFRDNLNSKMTIFPSEPTSADYRSPSLCSNYRLSQREPPRRLLAFTVISLILILYRNPSPWDSPRRLLTLPEHVVVRDVVAGQWVQSAACKGYGSRVSRYGKFNLLIFGNACW